MATWMEFFSNWADVIALAVSVIVAGLILGLTLGLKKDNVTDDSDDPTGVTVTATPGDVGITGQLQIVATDFASRKFNSTASALDACAAPTTAEQDSYNLTTDDFVCPSLPDGYLEDTKGYFFKGVFFDDGSEIPKYIFVKRGAGDLVVAMDNIQGDFYSGYLQFEEDIFSYGFDGEAASSDPAADLATMVDNLDEAVLLMGDAAAPTTCTPDFSFDILDPETNQLNIRNTENLTRASGRALRGVLRLSFDHVDYTYTLDGKTQSLRVLIGNCDGQIGDKLLLVDGSYQWYDQDAKAFVTTRPANPITFWNDSGDSDDDDFKTALVSAFETQRLGMPVALETDNDTKSINFMDIDEEDINITLNLLPDGYISFRNASSDGLSEADLVATPLEQISRFSIPDLSLKGIFSSN